LGSVKGDFAEIVIDEGGTRLRASIPKKSRDVLAVGDSGCISIRPVHLEICRDGGEKDRPNSFPGEVTRRLFLGENFEYTVRALGTDLKIRTLLNSPVEMGDKITVVFDPDNGICLPTG